MFRGWPRLRVRWHGCLQALQSACKNGYVNLTDTQKSLLCKIVRMCELGGTSSFIVAPTLSHGTSLVCEDFVELIDADEMDFRQLEKEGFVILKGAWEGNLRGKPTQRGIEAVEARFKSVDREIAKGHHRYRFPTPPGTSWQEITIKFIDGHTVGVTMGHSSRRFNFAELGMKDSRDGNPNTQWKLLAILAENGGRLSWQQSAAGPKKKKQVELLARRLQDFFGIAENPFHPYKKGTGWQIKARLESLR
jgi:hypothetical protein